MFKCSSWLLFSHLCSSAIAIPKGHLLPLGSHHDSEGQVEDVSGQTTALDFYTRFVNIGRPVVFRGVLNNSAAVQLWDDAYLR